MIGSRGKFWQKINTIRNPNCRLCPLHKTEGSVCVMGRGTAYAPIALIGEAPGEAEAKTGKPFMGRAGELLSYLLDENSMAHMVYITNICKCRPPENRRPKSSEMHMCSLSYLAPEMELLKPKVVVLLGKTPINAYFGKKPFSRGVIYEVSLDGTFLTSYQGDEPHPKQKGVCLIPTWHPSYIVRGYSKVAESQLKTHLLRAKEIANENLR